MKISTSVKDFILDNYNQVDLYAYWLNIYAEDIEYCIQHTSNKISNPLRVDNTPSLAFMYISNGKLIMKDWAESSYNGDIFHLVGIQLKLDSNNSEDFITICREIILSSRIVTPTLVKTKITRSITIIEFEAKEFYKDELEWWNKGGVSTNHLIARNVYSANRVFINDNINTVYEYQEGNPAYVYILNDRKKIYTPFNSIKKFRFITNSNIIFEAPNELYPAKTLIITKSRKDKLVIECNLENEDDCNTISDVLKDSNTEHDYCVISLLNESQRIKPKLGKYLINTYETIIINTDFDKEGIYCAFFHYVVYGFIPVFVGAKEIDYDILDNKYLTSLFKLIHKYVPNVTLHKGLLLEFIDKYLNEIEEKDLFEYFTINGITKGKELINNIFNIE